MNRVRHYKTTTRRVGDTTYRTVQSRGWFWGPYRPPGPIGTGLGWVMAPVMLAFIIIKIPSIGIFLGCCLVVALLADLATKRLEKRRRAASRASMSTTTGPNSTRPEVSAPSPQSGRRTTAADGGEGIDALPEVRSDGGIAFHHQRNSDDERSQGTPTEPNGEPGSMQGGGRSFDPEPVYESATRWDIQGGGRLNAETFERAIRATLQAASDAGRSHVNVISGDLHRSVGGYPGGSHRMPMCCSVMRQMMRPGDAVIASPPSGQGATLRIRYLLPR